MKKIRNLFAAACLPVVLLAAPAVSFAQGANEDLAKQLSNPISSLISVPFQLNTNSGIGPAGDGTRAQLNIQPVIPFDIGNGWSVVSRTILPVISQKDTTPTSGSQFGLGDTVQSLFFTAPAKATSGGGTATFGAGPVFLLPTGTDPLLSGEKWGLGATAVGLVQSGPWTFGALGNHIWSVAGDSSRADVNQSFIQPFLSYTTPQAVSLTVNSESTYDWDTNDWSVPVNFQVSKVVNFGNQPVSIGGGARYWADSANNGPEGWGARLFVTYLFPK